MHHEVIQKTLSNKISLILVPLPGTEAVTTLVFFGVGSRFESDSQQGLAHFTEHMVFKGGKKYKTAQDIAQALDQVGGEFNAFTSDENTAYYTKTARQHLELGLDVLSDMLLHAQFPAEELEKEKGVIVEELNMYEDMPMRKIENVMMAQVFGDTPLGRPIIGNKKSVTGFTREDFLKYREQFYKGAQCYLVVAGAVDPKTAPALVEQYFGGMAAGEPYQPVPAPFIPENRVVIEHKKSEQSHLMLTNQAFAAGDPRKYVFRVLSTILGGNMSSRLFVSVRERQGLCYYVHSYPHNFRDTGLLVSAAGADNNRLTHAVSAMVKEMQNLRDVPVSKDELNRAKQYLLGKTLLAIEDSEHVAELYGSQKVLEGKLTPLEEMEERILAVSTDEVQKMAQDLFTDAKTRLAVIGPQENKEELEKLLHFIYDR